MEYVGSHLFHVLNIKCGLMHTIWMGGKKSAYLLFMCINILYGYGRLSIAQVWKNCERIKFTKALEWKTAFQNEERRKTILKETWCNSTSSGFSLSFKLNWNDFMVNCLNYMLFDLLSERENVRTWL